MMKRKQVRLPRQKKSFLRAIPKTAIIAAFAIVLPGLVFVSNASGQCAFPTITGSVQPLSSQGAAQFEPASSLMAADQEVSDESRHDEPADARIVGFWKFKFVSEGNPGIPDGAVIDSGFVQWHGDGTEITNSSRPPATSSFCLGIWQNSGPSSYKLNHFALSSDLSGNLIGPAQIREEVTLNHKSNQYDGTFTIDQYDLSGNPLAHVEGRVTGKRITIDTQVKDVL